MNALLAAALAAVLALLAGFFYGRTVGEEHRIALMARDEKVVAMAADAAASAIAKLRPIHQTTRATLEREVRENTVYRDCRSGPVSMRAFNAAIPGYVEPAASGVVPAADADN
jgi:hypothetical protein